MPGPQTAVSSESEESSEKEEYQQRDKAASQSASAVITGTVVRTEEGKEISPGGRTHMRASVHGRTEMSSAEEASGAVPHAAAAEGTVSHAAVSESVIVHSVTSKRKKSAGQLRMAGGKQKRLLPPCGKSLANYSVRTYRRADGSRIHPEVFSYSLLQCHGSIHCVRSQ